ncbi:MAG: hypothetical protein OXJ90_11730 [Spirochaetaceae bacterium]|nr:hypothetical protein [Spirochaetaceae bacterium]
MRSLLQVARAASAQRIPQQAQAAEELRSCLARDGCPGAVQPHLQRSRPPADRYGHAVCRKLEVQVCRQNPGPCIDGLGVTLEVQ